MMPLSLAIATSARVSYWLGAGDAAQARARASAPASSWRWCMALALARARCCWRATASPRVYSADPQVVALAAGLLLWVALLPPGRRAADAVRVRAALLPRHGRAAGGLLRAAVGRGPGRRLPARLSRHRAAGARCRSPAAFWSAGAVALALTAAAFTRCCGGRPGAASSGGVSAAAPGRPGTRSRRSSPRPACSRCAVRRRGAAPRA